MHQKYIFKELVFTRVKLAEAILFEHLRLVNMHDVFS